jgi:hypothetical protein
MIPSPRPGSTRQAYAGMHYAIGTVARANPVVAAWRWRYELAVMAALAAGCLVLGPVALAVAAAGLAAALIGAVAYWPQGRAFLAARAWCIVTPHRVRVGCGQAWIHSRAGKIPAVLLTRRQPFGERVYLWCRAGTSADDLSSASVLLAAACWADDVRVTRSLRYAHLVTLDVIRRGQPGSPTAAPELSRVGATGGPLAFVPPGQTAGSGYNGQAPDDDMQRRQMSASSWNRELP